MKKMNGLFIPNEAEIRKEIRNSTKMAKDTGNYIQTWFDMITGTFCREEFVDPASYVCLNEDEYNIGGTYDDLDILISMMEEHAMNQQ